MVRTDPVRIAAAVALALGTTAAFADTANLTVNATVNQTCKFTSTPALAFTIDPSLATAVTSTTTVEFKCSKGTVSSNFSVGGSTNGTTGYTSGTTQATGALYSSTTTEAMQYSITWTNPASLTGNGFGGAGRQVVLTGSVAPAQFQNATPANNYTATVQLSVTP